MAKTLRIRTAAGWATKPAADLPENRLMAEEVDDNFLALELAISGKSDAGHTHSGEYDPAGTASAALAAHVASGDPHPGYLTQAEGDAAYAKKEIAFNLGAALTGSQTLNAANGALQYGTTTGATTWTFSGAAATGTVTAVTLELANGGSATQTWPASVKWDGGTAPTLTAAGLDVLEFYTRDGGTTWRGFLAAKDSK